MRHEIIWPMLFSKGPRSSPTQKSAIVKAARRPAKARRRKKKMCRFYCLRLFHCNDMKSDSWPESLLTLRWEMRTRLPLLHGYDDEW
jgi:hypothetical protein